MIIIVLGRNILWKINNCYLILGLGDYVFVENMEKICCLIIGLNVIKEK